MIKPVAFANAFTVVGLAGYVICRVLSLVAPDLLFSIGQSWFHTFNLNTVRATVPLDFGTFLVGGITFGLLVWIASFAGVTLYNKWAK